jgi:hypothetical protein
VKGSGPRLDDEYRSVRAARDVAGDAAAPVAHADRIMTDDDEIGVRLAPHIDDLRPGFANAHHRARRNADRCGSGGELAQKARRLGLGDRRWPDVEHEKLRAALGGERDGAVGNRKAAGSTVGGEENRLGHHPAIIRRQPVPWK